MSEWKCQFCGAPGAWSEKSQKYYCSAKCWLNKNNSGTPSGQGYRKSQPDDTPRRIQISHAWNVAAASMSDKEKDMEDWHKVLELKAKTVYQMIDGWLKPKQLPASPPHAEDDLPF